MREIKRQIVEILKGELNFNRAETLGVIVPLKTEEKALKMLEYLKENKDDEYLMRIDRLLKKSVSIAEGL